MNSTDEEQQDEHEKEPTPEGAELEEDLAEAFTPEEDESLEELVAGDSAETALAEEAEGGDDETDPDPESAEDKPERRQRGGARSRGRKTNNLPWKAGIKSATEFFGTEALYPLRSASFRRKRTVNW